MSGVAYWIVGGIAGLIGLAGLFIAAGNTGAAFWGGLVVFVAAVLFAFWLIKHWFDQQAVVERKDSGKAH